jgi:GTP pyrophosphokinase
MGKNALDVEFKRIAPRITESKRQEIVNSVSRKIGFNTADDMYNAIGYGELPVSKLLKKLKDEIAALQAEEVPETPAAEVRAEDVQTKPRPRHLKSNSGIIVDGAEGCAVKFAKCCNPLPGDEVVGFVTKGFGISIHKQDCPNFVQGRDNPDLRDRWKPARWEGVVNENSKSVYEALLQIHTLDTVGVLADITVALADMKVSILQINSQKAGADRVIINLKISCKNVEHYNSIVSRLRGLKNILDVTRGFS